jgi:hypothetical protein
MSPIRYQNIFKTAKLSFHINRYIKSRDRSIPLFTDTRFTDIKPIPDIIITSSFCGIGLNIGFENRPIPIFPIPPISADTKYRF